ncbi:cytochrome C oxidase subunit IV family protein [Azospirillum picis]|uniref:Cytochrome c oxidase subunit 4 n=1 Tax=Azospirillum picis TaxID=488438 RepID=A0ABU0MS16_9PROT|nr:cytochrome C oxidase subunit IV family protein [Azospirillum picis]MBP2302430.1 cytochrome c oxidase subunit 4 [Azospirillum picis]MDQ0536009.1 cytochrome c oxidase subunit 4 [Azospirillum picis]
MKSPSPKGLPRALLLTWVALLALLAATLALAYVPMSGPLNVAVALGISAGKALLVLAVFMKLFRASALTRAAAAAGLFWLGILFALAATDYLTRTVEPAGELSAPTGRNLPAEGR